MLTSILFLRFPICLESSKHWPKCYSRWEKLPLHLLMQNFTLKYVSSLWFWNISFFNDCFSCGYIFLISLFQKIFYLKVTLHQTLEEERGDWVWTKILDLKKTNCKYCPSFTSESSQNCSSCWHIFLKVPSQKMSFRRSVVQEVLPQQQEYWKRVALVLNQNDLFFFLAKGHHICNHKSITQKKRENL